MTQRIRINEIYTPQRTYRRNDIYRQFSSAFNVVFSSDPLTLENGEADTLYIKNPDIEDHLLGFASSPLSHLNYVIGETGIGKSTYIRKVFGDKGNPRFFNKSLIIPFYLNGKTIDKDNYREVFRRKIQSGWTKYNEEFAENGNINQEEIFNFIKENNSDLLESEDPFASFTADQALKNLLKTDPYAFYAELLKYCCCKHEDISKIVILYDDIESIVDQATQFLFISQACRFQSCFTNAAGRNFSVTSIISLRPSTKRLLDTNDWFHAHTPNDELEIDDPVELKSIFEARIEYLVKYDSDTKYKNVKCIEDALKTLKSVVSRVPHFSINALLQLSNYNFRIALTSLSTILSNRRFIQANSKPDSYFTINVANYHTDPANIVRSITLGEHDVYTDHNSKIFNIFKNTENPDTDMILFYICKYFYFKNSKKWRHLEKIDKEVLFQDIKMISDDDQSIEYFVNYLISEYVIELIDVRDGDRSVKCFLAKPKLFGIFSLLQENSVLCESLRDDVYIERNYIEISSEINPITRIKKDSDKLLANLSFWKWIIESEKRFLNRIHPEKRNTFIRKFGGETASSIVGAGYKELIYATGHEGSALYKELVGEVEKLEKIYHNA